MQRAVIYRRISEDPKRTGVGVARQLKDCEALCERLGLRVVGDYCDNDRSAYKETVKRPGYDAVLDLVRRGEVDVVVSYKLDRLGRRLRTLIDLYDLLLETGVTIRLVSGDVDLSTPHGIAMAQMAAVMAENYVRTSRENNLRARRELAQSGVRHCTRRPYGWEPGGLVVRESEATIVREIVRRLIQGESPTNIAADLNDRNIPTVEGKRWTGIGVRKCGTRPSNAAIREHNGQLYYNGQWEPIITHEQYEEVQLSFKRRQSIKYKRGVGRKYLLTGYALCGNCGHKLSPTVGSGDRKAAYRCIKTRSNDRSPLGCGKVSRQIAPLELLVQKAVLTRLDSPALLTACTQQDGDNHEARALLAKITEQKTRIGQLVDDYATGLLDTAQLKQAKQLAEARLSELNAQLTRATFNQSLGHLDLAGDLAEAWQSRSLTWRRSLIELLIERVEVLPYPPRFTRVTWEGYRFDPTLVKVVWRV